MKLVFVFMPKNGVKVLSCAVTYNGGDHAVVIYDITNFGEIKMKNTYRGDGQITPEL